MSVGQWFLTLLELTKARITIATTLSAATGYLLFSERFEIGVLVPMAGVFLLACGSAALNQVQEWRTDALMPRTRNRPVPSGRLSVGAALGIVIVLVVAGLNVLAAVESHALLVVGLGALAVAWYNGLYLWMKRTTAFAAVPGALVGAIPPAIGWCAAGGALTDRTILEVGFFFFIWQIPHFWLLVQLYAGQYEHAGLPMPTRHLDEDQFRRMTSAWILATVAVGIALVVRQQMDLPWNFLALAASISLGIAAVVRRDRRGPKVAVALFARINFYMFVMMVLLVANACW
jgi:protoheme IX farnesyltransferase